MTTKTITFNCELTDTFGGEANYSWVTRASITVPEDATDRTIVRRAKAALGLTGVRCKVHNYGGWWEICPYGACMVAFVTFADHWSE